MQDRGIKATSTANEAIGGLTQGQLPSRNERAAERVAPQSIVEIVSTLKSSNEDVWHRAIQELREIGREAIPTLVNALKDSELVVRCRATYALGAMGSEAKVAVPALVASLKDSEWLVRSCAAGALGDIGPAATESVPALLEALNDSDFGVQLDVESALQRIRGPV